MFAALGFLKSAQLDVGTRPELQELLTLWGAFRLCGAYTQLRTVFKCYTAPLLWQHQGDPQESHRAPGVSFRLVGGPWKSQVGSSRNV